MIERPGGWVAEHEAIDEAAIDWIAGFLGDRDCAGDVVARLRSRGLMADRDPWSDGSTPEPPKPPSPDVLAQYEARMVEVGGEVCLTNDEGYCEAHGMIDCPVNAEPPKRVPDVTELPEWAELVACHPFVSRQVEALIAAVDSRGEN